LDAVFSPTGMTGTAGPCDAFVRLSLTIEFPAIVDQTRPKD
jgi:hypothetical protein